MKTRTQKKLSLEKLQITRLSNLSFIRGGDGETDPPNTESQVLTDCPAQTSKDQNNCESQGNGTCGG